MQEIQALKHLHRQMLLMSLGKFECRMINETGKVVREVLEYHEALVFLHHNFLQ